ncbi:MAG: hypothetical protein FWF25_01180 [Propionibacteriaceae bacterium]|nr:hypothetical protein [Propionibacteriaceae bacterium]
MGDGTKLGMIGNWFGSIVSELSAWAVFEYVKKLGYDPVFFNAPMDYAGAHSGAGRLILDRCSIFPVLQTQTEYMSAIKTCSSFVVFGDALDYGLNGSSGHYYYLDFVPESKPKVAFEIEFPLDYYAPQEYMRFAKDCLHRFSKISAAASSSKRILNHDYALESDALSSPLLLLQNADIASITEGVTPSSSEAYAAVCLSSADRTKWDISNAAEQYCGLKPINADPSMGAVEYLAHIGNAALVITDDPGIAIVSIVLNKPFVLMTTASDGSDRVAADTLNPMHLTQQILNIDDLPPGWEQLFNRAINYAVVNPQVEFMRKKAETWLQEALASAMPKSEPLADDMSVISGCDEHVSPKPVYQPVHYKIQNLMLPDCEWKNDHWWLFHRGTRLFYNGNPINPFWTLTEGSVEFFTYFNSLAVKKWTKYSISTKFFLHLRVKGKFRVRLFGRWLEPKSENADQSHKSMDHQLEETLALPIGDAARRSFCHQIVGEAVVKEEALKEYIFNCEESGESNSDSGEVVVPILYQDASIVGFEIIAETPCELYEGWYSVLCYEEDLNRVDISLCTTTFKKEDYVTRNAELINREVLVNPRTGGMDDLSKHLFVNIVDNGRTLDPEDFNGYRMRLHHNINTGGSGGFTRGMLETLALSERGEFAATHILLMDDDVQLLPETLKRTYALLRLLKDEHRGKFISGAMLDLDQMNEQHEDVGYVSTQLGIHTPVKPRYLLHESDAILRNDIEYSLEHMYAGWWYCCIPMQYVAEDSLTIPIFYRGDDVEFSLRNNPGFIAFNGICVWHMGFDAKVTTSLEYYLVIRNALIAQAISSIVPQVDYVKRIERLFREEIRKFNYQAAEHLLDALEDYLKGPEYYVNLDGEQVIKAQSARNEKLYPYDTLGYPLDESRVYEYAALGMEDMKLFEDTDNGHLLPDYLLRDDTVPEVAHLYFVSPGKQFLRKRVLSVNIHDKTAVVHTMDRKRYTELIMRHDTLLSRYETDGSAICQRYRDYSSTFHSAEFWRKYLDL